MDHIGIDVHKRESQIYILAAGGGVIVADPNFALCLRLQRGLRAIGRGERLEDLVEEILEREDS